MKKIFSLLILAVFAIAPAFAQTIDFDEILAQASAEQQNSLPEDLGDGIVWTKIAYDKASHIQTYTYSVVNKEYETAFQRPEVGEMLTNELSKELNKVMKESFEDEMYKAMVGGGARIRIVFTSPTGKELYSKIFNVK